MKKLSAAFLQKTLSLKPALIGALFLAFLPSAVSAESFDDTVDAGLDAILMGEFNTLVDYLQFKKAENDPMAIYVLGVMHEHGTLVSKDFQAAGKLYHQSATLDCVEAKVAIGVLNRKIAARRNEVSGPF
ncbi:MAG: SEL1-like repeat protein [Alphaproteobacteria bacterium]|nr:SEL1-like repeat protein [Alphaproteobacteria bacterium]